MLVLGALALALGWWQYSAARGWATAALIGVTAILFGHAGVLAFEFALLRRASRSDPAPKSTGGDIARAWWAETRAATRVFCWQQPFASARWPDHLPADARGRRGVLLLHGFLCNRGFWNPWLGRLIAMDVPTLAINLEPPFGSIDAYRVAIEDALTRLELATGMAPIVVAHSMGGLAFRRWFAAQRDAARIHRVITLGTPHKGTWLARYALSANGREMRSGSEWLRALEADEDPARAALYTCFYSHCDNIVLPPSTATLAGADNRHLRATAHVDMAGHPEPWQALMTLLAENAPMRAANS